jgi:hypothetical protein
VNWRQTLMAGMFTLIGALIAGGATILNSKLTANAEHLVRVRNEKIEALKAVYNAKEVLVLLPLETTPSTESIERAMANFHAARWVVSMYFPDETKTGAFDDRGSPVRIRQTGTQPWHVELDHAGAEKLESSLQALARKVVNE